MVGGLILAAGAGRRIGRGPKALLLEGEITFLEHCVASCQGAGCDPVWVVVRPDSLELARLAASLPVRAVVNPDPERGMFSSFQCAAREAVLESMKGVVVHPVDHPRVLASTIRMVAREIDDRAWVVPRFGSRPGHPIGIGIQLAASLVELPDTLTLRQALVRAGATRIEIEVDDPGVLDNVNTKKGSRTP